MPKNIVQGAYHAISANDLTKLPIAQLSVPQVEFNKSCLFLEVRDDNYHDKRITALQLLSNNKMVLAISDAMSTDESYFNIIDLPTKKRVMESPARSHDSKILALAELSPDLLVSGSVDTTIKLWDLTNHNDPLVFILKGHDNAVTTLAVLPKKSFAIDGCATENKVSFYQLASGSTAGIIKIWAIHTYKNRSKNNLQSIIKNEQPSGLLGFFKSRDDAYLTLQGHQSAITSLVTLPDERLASASQYESIKIWNIKNGLCLHTIPTCEHPVSSLTTDNANRLILSGSQDGQVTFWNMQTYQKNREFKLSKWLSIVSIKYLTADTLIVLTNREDSYTNKTVIHAVDYNGKLISQSLDAYSLPIGLHENLLTVSEENLQIAQVYSKHYAYVWNAKQPCATTHIQKIFDLLQTNTSVTTLDFQNYPIDQSLFEPLINLLRHNTNIKAIDLRNTQDTLFRAVNTLSSENFSLLLNLLNKETIETELSKQLTKKTLLAVILEKQNNNNLQLVLQKASAGTILSALPQTLSPKISEYYDKVASIINYLRSKDDDFKNPYTTLNIVDNNFENLKTFTYLLSAFSTIHILSPIAESFAVLMVTATKQAALQNQLALRSIVLAPDSVSEEWKKSFIDAEHFNALLNGIPQEMNRPVTVTITHNTYCSEFKLSHPNLVALDLSYTKLNNETISSLNALTNLPQLRTLRLNDTNLPDNINDWLTFLKKLQHLETLECRHQKWTDKAFEALLGYLESNPSLKHIYLCDGKSELSVFSDDQIHQLIETIRYYNSNLVVCQLNKPSEELNKLLQRNQRGPALNQLLANASLSLQTVKTQLEQNQSKTIDKLSSMVANILSHLNNLKESISLEYPSPAASEANVVIYTEVVTGLINAWLELVPHQQKLEQSILCFGKAKLLHDTYLPKDNTLLERIFLAYYRQLKENLVFPLKYYEDLLSQLKALPGYSLYSLLTESYYLYCEKIGREIQQTETLQQATGYFKLGEEKWQKAKKENLLLSNRPFVTQLTQQMLKKYFNNFLQDYNVDFDEKNKSAVIMPESKEVSQSTEVLTPGQLLDKQMNIIDKASQWLMSTNLIKTAEESHGPIEPKIAETIAVVELLRFQLLAGKMLMIEEPEKALKACLDLYYNQADIIQKNYYPDKVRRIYVDSCICLLEKFQTQSKHAHNMLAMLKTIPIKMIDQNRLEALYFNLSKKYLTNEIKRYVQKVDSIFDWFDDSKEQFWYKLRRDIQQENFYVGLIRIMNDEYNNCYHQHGHASYWKEVLSALQEMKAHIEKPGSIQADNELEALDVKPYSPEQGMSNSQVHFFSHAVQMDSGDQTKQEPSTMKNVSL